eukprot:132429-Pelagomonas_calceolata.AAC.1
MTTPPQVLTERSTAGRARRQVKSNQSDLESKNKKMLNPATQHLEREGKGDIAVPACRAA